MGDKKHNERMDEISAMIDGISHDLRHGLVSPEEVADALEDIYKELEEMARKMGVLHE